MDVRRGAAEGGERGRTYASDGRDGYPLELGLVEGVDVAKALCVVLVAVVGDEDGLEGLEDVDDIDDRLWYPVVLWEGDVEEVWDGRR